MLRYILVLATAGSVIFGATQTRAQIVISEENLVAVSQTNSTTGFFDSSSGTREVVFNAEDFSGTTGIVTDVDISISFAKSDNNSFVPQGGQLGTGTPFHNETEFALTSPTGTSFTLISNNGDTEIVPADSFESFNTGDSGGFQGTILFDQDAAAPVNADPNNLTSGTFRPDDNTSNSLDIFNGESALGTWSLFIEDDIGLDGLSFYEYTLTITTEAQAVPEPTSAVVIGFAGSLLLMPRRRQV